MAKHYELGKIGENSAADFLINKGFTLLHRNWRHGKYEVDIIALDGPLLVFVEVKTRSSYRYGFPDESVNTKKERMLVEAAEIFVEEENRNCEIRFDLISIVKNDAQEKIYHIEDAFHG
ncbi:MAG: YraN family protein [Flavobacteriales bacterium]|nr:YraN family protein [Flavobacteriales bacterium]